MSLEGLPLQKDMFTGELVDNRSRDQKRAEREKAQPHQLEMFRQKDIAQFGVSANPMMPYSPGKLVLIREDPRTPEEIEHDLQRAAEALTVPMFAKTTTPALPEKQRCVPTSTEIPMIGYRFRARRGLLSIRQRADVQ